MAHLARPRCAYIGKRLHRWFAYARRLAALPLGPIGSSAPWLDWLGHPQTAVDKTISRDKRKHTAHLRLEEWRKKDRQYKPGYHSFSMEQRFFPGPAVAGPLAAGTIAAGTVLIGRALLESPAFTSPIGVPSTLADTLLTPATTPGATLQIMAGAPPSSGLPKSLDMLTPTRLDAAYAASESLVPRPSPLATNSASDLDGSSRTSDHSTPNDIFRDPFLDDDPFSNSPGETGPGRSGSAGGGSAPMFNLDNGQGGGAPGYISSPIFGTDSGPIPLSPSITNPPPMITGSGSPTQSQQLSSLAPHPVVNYGGPFTPASTPVRPSLATADPMWILDVNKGIVVTPGVDEQAFSNWPEDLLAQVSGADVSSYSWNTTNAPDATSITGSSTYSLQFNWKSFSGAARTDTISVKETPTSGSALTQTLTFVVASTSSPSYVSTPVTNSSTWSTVITPDAISNRQDSGGYGPYYSLGLDTGELDIDYALPSYNPGVPALDLVYSSAAADPQPVFITHYQLNPSVAVPSTVDATLTLDGTAGSTFYYSTSSLNPGDIMQIALQGNASSLSTGRYSYQVQIVANYSTPVTTTYSGNVDIVNDSSSPFGAGWSLDFGSPSLPLPADSGVVQGSVGEIGLEHIWAVTGGVILETPGGVSLWFANGGTAGTFTTPAGDFSTLTQNTMTNVYTRTMPDGTKIYFNGSGYQTSVVDRDGNTLTYGYTSNELTTITDPYGLVTTITYSGGQAASITDPAGRITTLTQSSGDLTAITDPDGAGYSYAYNSSNEMTTLTNPLSNTTSFAYNFAGQISTVTRADSSTEELTALQSQGLVPAGQGTSGSPATSVLTAQAQAVDTDPRGNAWSTRLDWLGFGEAVQTQDPLSDITINYVDPNGLDWLTSDPLGRRDRTFFDSLGNPTTIVLADDNTEHYVNNSFSEPTKYTDPTGFWTTYTYNSNGDLTVVSREGPFNTADPTTYTYNSQGFETSMKDPLGNVTSYGLDSRNRPVTVTNATTKVVTIGYDTASDMTTEINQLGNTTTYTFDGMGRELTMALPDNNPSNHPVYTYGYDAAGNQVSVTAPLGDVTTTTFDKLNQPIAVTDANGHTMTYTFDGDGNQVAVTNALGYTATSTFDTADREVGTIDELGNTTTYMLDADGEKLNVIDPLGRVTTYTYLSRGWISTATDPLWVITSYAYDAAGDLTQWEIYQGTPPGHPSCVNCCPGCDIFDKWTYDSQHENITYTDFLDQLSTFTFDKAGNQTAVTDPLGHTTTSHYDQLNRTDSVKDPLGNLTSTGYDVAGNTISQTDPLSRTTTFGYDAQNRQVSSEDARGAMTSYTYDLDGRQITVTDPDSNTTTYTLDAVGNQLAVTTPIGQTTYSYNAVNEKVGETDADGRQMTFGYDKDGHRTSEQWLNSLGQATYTATYVFDAAGELSSAQDNNSSYAYTYDLDGHLEVVDNSGTPSVPHVVLTYSYNIVGNVDEVQDNLNNTITYTFDDDQHLTQADMKVNGHQGPYVTLAYDSAGNKVGVTYKVGTSGSYLHGTYSFDKADRLTTLTYTSSAAGALATYLYSFDHASQVTQYAGPEGTLTYTYDLSGELSGVGDAQTATYSFDSNGNRTMTGYTTGPDNELTADGTNTFAYDGEGNLTSETNTSTGQVTQYTWDDRNRLTQEVVKDSSGVTLTNEQFTYDVNNLRIGFDVNGTQTWTVWDRGNPYADFNGSGSLQYVYLYGEGLDTLLARFDGTTAMFYLTDALGSVRQDVNVSGTVLDAITYDAFGNILTETSPSSGDRFKYTGREYDSATSLEFNRARYYSPKDGRWITQDPLAYSAGDTNLYRYTGNSPTLSTDPTGEWNWGKAIRKGIAAGEGGAVTGAIVGSFFPSLGITTAAGALGFGLIGGWWGFWTGGMSDSGDENPVADAVEGGTVALATFTGARFMTVMARATWLMFVKANGTDPASNTAPAVINSVGGSPRFWELTREINALRSAMQNERNVLMLIEMRNKLAALLEEQSLLTARGEGPLQ